MESSISPEPNIHSDSLHKFPKAADPNKLLSILDILKQH